MSDAAGGPDAWAVDVVRRVAAGDRAAEDELVRHYERGVGYLLRRMAGDPALAEDLRQDTLRVVLERVRAGELRDPSRLGGFVRATARNLLIAERRRRARRATDTVDTLPETVDPAPGPAARAEAEEDRRRVRRVLAALPSARDREALYRIHLAEEERDTVARDLGLTPAQLSLVLFRARQRFRELLQRDRAASHGVR